MDQIRQAWREGLGPGLVRQHANESPWDVPAELKADIIQMLAELPFSRYDWALRPLLLAALARYTGMPADCIVPGTGADELIQLSMISLVGPGGRVVTTSPTFFVYPHTAAALGREVQDVPLRRPGYELDVAGLRRAVRPGDLVFICRPNNPTGNVFAAADVLQVLDDCEARGATVVLDEAYYEFCGQTLVDEIISGRRERVLALRTMSKAFRLAGLRLGYALLARPLVEPFERARLTYNISAASMVAALGVLSQPALAARTAKTTAELRSRFSERLAGLPGVTVHPSETNFIFVELPCAAEPVQRALAEQGLLLRYFAGSEQLAQALRISIGDDDDNEKIVAALDQALRRFADCPGGPPQ